MMLQRIRSWFESFFEIPESETLRSETEALEALDGLWFGPSVDDFWAASRPPEALHIAGNSAALVVSYQSSDLRVYQLAGAPTKEEAEHLIHALFSRDQEVLSCFRWSELC